MLLWLGHAVYACNIIVIHNTVHNQLDTHYTQFNHTGRVTSAQELKVSGYLHMVKEKKQENKL